jgi:hypothetical protein
MKQIGVRPYMTAVMAALYAACKPACSLAGGPFPLLGLAYYGHLNKKGNIFAAADEGLAQIDLYKYRSTPKPSLTYEYSFNNGLSSGSRSIVFGVAFNPRSAE